MDQNSPSFRSSSPRASARTFLYGIIGIVALSFPFGFLLLLILREGRRYQIRAPIEPIREQIAHDYRTRLGRKATRTRIWNSAPGQALFFQVILIPAWLLMGLYALTVPVVPGP